MVVARWRRLVQVVAAFFALRSSAEGGWISDLLGIDGGVEPDTELHMRAAEAVAGGDSVLGPDAILWSPKMARSTFYRDHWEGRGASSWVHFPAQDRLDAGLSTHADRLWLDAATIRAVISRMDIQTARAHVKTAQLSGPVSCTEGGRACIEHAAFRNDTLVFDGGEYLLPAVHSLVDSWKRYWNVYVGANFYLTPAGTQAFGYHSDHTDVFVLQLEGTKQWSVCDRVLPNLNDKASFGKVNHFFPDNEAQKLTSLQRTILASCRPVTLRRGDALYLAAGVVHRAVAPAGSDGGDGAHNGSMHCSVSVSRTHHQHSWATFIETVLRTAAAAPSSRHRVALDEDFVYFVHSLAATGGRGGVDRGGRSLLQMPASFSSTGLPLPRDTNKTDPQGQELSEPEWQWNRLAVSIDPTSDLPSTFVKTLQLEFEQSVQPLLEQAARRLGGATTDIVMERIAELKTSVLGEEKTITAALASSYHVMHSGMMKPLQVNWQDGSSSSQSYHSQQAKIIEDHRAKAEADADSIRDYYARGHGLDEIIVQRPTELRVHLDPKKLSFDLSANVAGYEWPITVGAGVEGSSLTQSQRKAAAHWCLAGFQGASGAPFSVREVEPVFAERKPAARKSKKARQVAAVPDNAGELAMEMVQWLVRRGLLQLMRLGPPVEHSAKLASGLGAVDHDDL